MRSTSNLRMDTKAILSLTSVFILLLSLHGLLGCNGWQQLSLDQYRQQGAPIGEELRVTCVDGSVHLGRLQRQSNRDTLVLELGADTGIMLTIPLSQIRRVEFYRPVL
jgi:hypothetical protein